MEFETLKAWAWLRLESQCAFGHGYAVGVQLLFFH